VLKVVVTAADELLTDQGPLVPVDVLLVEDDPGDVLMTREAFEQRGMRNRLYVVSDGKQASSSSAGRANSPRRPRPA
jgi:hypothetical protein